MGVGRRIAPLVMAFSQVAAVIGGAGPAHAENSREVSADSKTIYMAEIEQDTGFHEHWAALKSAIEDHGYTVVTPEVDHEENPMVYWTRDSYVEVDGHALLPDARVYKQNVSACDEEDAAECSSADEAFLESTKNEYVARTEQTARFMKEKGIDAEVISGHWFEGGNVILHEKSKTVFLGVPEWADKETAEVLAVRVSEIKGEAWSGVAVPLEDDGYFYHLDTFMSDEMNDGSVLFYADATDESTARLIESKILASGGEVYQLSSDEANARQSNFLELDTHSVIMIDENERIQSILESKGYEVSTPGQKGIDKYEWSWSGPRCQTNKFPGIG
ncbi:MAG: hypothetical protein CMH32_03615 [Micavibrio sp.]|nr:hypothetical protein [Micavibrio sp.]